MKTLATITLATVLLLLTANIGMTHPDDEFCTPGDDSMDPELCRQLAALDARDGDVRFAGIDAVRDASGNVRGFWPTAALYVTIGVRHILPGGLDHILFVIAMFLGVTGLRALVILVSAFTVAHTVTLGMTATGVITPSAAIVEPLIAFTIGWVALENLWFRDASRWRPYVVFGFGLIHGMGFAGFFGELGLPPGQFWSSLIGFNIGVEIGQLAVIALLVVLFGVARRWVPENERARYYRRFAVVPGSILIGVIGFYWTAERLISMS